MSIASISANENMPIILSGMDKISTEATEFIDNNKINKSYIVGGDSVVSSDLEKKLPNATRISGKNRKETNANVIKFIDNNKINKSYIVGGDSVVSSDLEKKLPNATRISGKNRKETNANVIRFIDNNKINKSYIVGGDSVVSSDLEKKLPNATRISGKNRKETNANVISTFFTAKEIDNLYIAKDGMQSENQLIDALSVGSLAAKTNSPVMIAGNDLDKSQIDLVNRVKIN